MQTTNNEKLLTIGSNTAKQTTNNKENTKKERNRNENKTKIIVTEYYCGAKSLKEKMLSLMIKEIKEVNNEQK